MEILENIWWPSFLLSIDWIGKSLSELGYLIICLVILVVWIYFKEGFKAAIENLIRTITKGLLIAVIGWIPFYFLALGYSWKGYEVEQAEEATARETKPLKIEKVSIKFTEEAPQLLFAITDLPRPHLYIKVPYEVLNPSSETRFASATGSYEIKGLPASWTCVENDIYPMGGDNVSFLESGKFKLSGKDSHYFYVSLQFATDDQRSKDFPVALSKIESITIKLKLTTDQNDVISAEKKYPFRDLALGQLKLALDKFYTSFPTLKPD